MKQTRLLRTLLVALCLLVGTNAWGYTETLSGSDSPTKDTDFAKTSFTVLGNYWPDKSDKTINSKTCLKVRWNQTVEATGNEKGFALKVNDGYTITGITAQMSGNSKSLTLKDIKIDGVAYSGNYTKAIPANDSYNTITLSDINAKDYINFVYDSGDATQGFVYITVTYELNSRTVYSKSLSEWNSDDVTKTEGTLNKWYNSTGITNNEVYTGMMINAEKGLRLAARNTTSTATLKFNHTTNTIVTIDAVWNVGNASADGNTPNNKFQFGDLLIQQNVRSNNLTTTYKINGSTKTVGTDKFAREDDMTIHLKVNSYTGSILEFSLKNGETEVASFAELTTTTNHFAAGTEYDEVTLTSWISASSSYAWCALKSITISEQEQKIYSYTVNAVDEASNTLYKVTEGTVLSSDNSVKVTYDAFYLKGNNLLQADRHDNDNKEYNYTFNVTENNQVINIIYKDKGYNNVIFYKEAENIETLSSVNSGNVPVRCSGGKGGYAATDAKIASLPAGKYKVSSFAYGTSGTNLSIYAGETLVKTFGTASAALSVTTSDEFTLNETTDIIFKEGGNGGSSPKVLDFIFIQNTSSDKKIIGTVDNSTYYLTDMSDKKTLKPGESYHYQFVNYNKPSNNANGWNWVLPVYASGAAEPTIVLRQDNWEDKAGSNKGCWLRSNGSDDVWTDFINQMNGATVDMTVSYTEEKVINVSCDVTTSGSNSWKYTYSSDYEGSTISFADKVDIALSVSYSWLELLSEGYSAVSATITPTGYATFSSPYALDFSGAIDNLDAAYYASAVAQGSVTMTKLVQAVPAETGLFLKGKANETVTIPVVASGTDINGTNYLKPNTSESTVTASTENAYHYVFAYTTSDGSNPGFFNLGNNVTLGAGKAYIETTTSIKPTAGAKVSILFTDTELTGVVNAEANETTNAKAGKIYNIAGQVVTESYKGIKIIDGKKVF